MTTGLQRSKTLQCFQLKYCILDTLHLPPFRIFGYVFAIQVTLGNVVKLEFIQLPVVGLTVELMDIVLLKTATQCASVTQNGSENNANS